MQEKQAHHVYNLSFAPFFPAILVSDFAVCKSSTKLGSTFESTAEPNYLGSTQIDIRFGTCKVRRLSRALLAPVQVHTQVSPIQ